MEQQLNEQEEKLAELLVFLANRLRDEPAAGATKINKLAFFAEFTHVRMTGYPITGVDYQRLQNGPAPRRLVPIRRWLEQQGVVKLVKEPHLARIQHRLVALRPANESVFSESEIAAIEQVLEVYKAESGASLSELSHNEPAWNLAKNGETIPYEAAFLRAGQPGQNVLQQARKLAERVTQSS